MKNAETEDVCSKDLFNFMSNDTCKWLQLSTSHKASMSATEMNIVLFLLLCGDPSISFISIIGKLSGETPLPCKKWGHFSTKRKTSLNFLHTFHLFVSIEIITNSFVVQVNFSCLDDKVTDSRKQK
jgi:hypothetical protein